jgi:N-acetylmuramoyl-L-alanine amidase
MRRTLGLLMMLLVVLLRGVGVSVANAATLSSHPVAGQPSTVAACGGYYTVRTGDTLANIAGRCSVGLQTLVAANGLGWYSRVYPGQRLVIPSTRPASPAARPVTSGNYGCTNPYVVRAGDTLASIAARCGTTVANLLGWNGLSRNTVFPGQSVTTRGAPVAVLPSQSSGSASRTLTARPTPAIEPPLAP